MTPVSLLYWFAKALVYVRRKRGFPEALDYASSAWDTAGTSKSAFQCKLPSPQ